jgi:hypothetical protein
MHFQMVVERDRIMIDGQEQLVIRKQRIQHSEYAGMSFHVGNFAHVEFENMIFNNGHSVAFFNAGLQVACSSAAPQDIAARVPRLRCAVTTKSWKAAFLFAFRQRNDGS